MWVPGPLEKQPTLLTAEPSLQSLNSFLYGTAVAAGAGREADRRERSSLSPTVVLKDGDLDRNTRRTHGKRRCCSGVGYQSGKKGYREDKDWGSGVRGRAAFHLVPFCPFGCLIFTKYTQQSQSMEQTIMIK